MRNIESRHTYQLITLLLLAIVLLFAPAFSRAETIKLSFIHSYHFGYLWVQDYRRAFFEHLQEGVEVQEFEMDTKRLYSEQQIALATDNAKLFFVETNPDVVVISDDLALKNVGPFVQAYDVPIFFSGINANPRQYVDLTSQVSGVLERPLLLRSVSMIGKVLSNVKKIKVLMDDSPSSQAILDTSFGNKLSQSITGIQVDGVMLAEYGQWQQEVIDAAEQGYDAIVLLVYSRLKGEQGDYLSTRDVDTWTSKNSTVPVFGTWEFSIGKGRALGGFSLSGYEQGKALAEQVNRYLQSGKMPSVVTPKKGSYVYSRYELGRWGIHLPDDIVRLTEFKE